jgi:hypothetical protein
MHYKPPFASQRLRNDENKALRTGAESSVELMQLLLLMYTVAGDVILDPFGGTMSMGLACLTTGRK